MIERRDLGAEIRRSGGVALAAMVGIAFGMSALPISYTLGVFTPALVQAFGWSRTDIGFVTVVALAGVVIGSAGVGWIVDRYGVRRITLFSQLCLGLGLISLGLFVRTLGAFYGIFFFMGLLAAGSLPITFAKAVVGAFERNRGLALGFALAGTGVCGFVAPVYATWFLGAYGWRIAYVALAALPLCIALPLAWFQLREPASPVAAPRVAVGSESLRRAACDYRFWVMAAVFFAISGGVTGTLTSLVPLLTDAGYSAMAAAQLVSALGLAVIGGRLLVGFLLDRWWGPLVGLLFLLPPACALAELATGHPGPAGTVVSVVVIGLAIGAEVDLNAFMTARFFGLSAYGRVYTAQYLAIAIGASLAVPVFGRVRDLTGSYRDALLVSAAVFALGAFALLSLGRYPRSNPPGGGSPAPLPLSARPPP